MRDSDCGRTSLSRGARHARGARPSGWILSDRRADLLRARRSFTSVGGSSHYSPGHISPDHASSGTENRSGSMGSTRCFRSTRSTAWFRLRLVFLSLVLGTLGFCSEPAADILIADFEDDSFGDWEISDKAFSFGPARTGDPGVVAHPGVEGVGYASSNLGGYRA